jgi:HK97 family phage major capsid protein
MISDPTQPDVYRLNGSPVTRTTQMPDIAPGATPILFGDLKKTYILITRKAVTMMQDPFTMAYCILFRFDARVGGGVVCPAASKLLRVR